tara:strand:+ start:1613 stop:2407 length:795 start_codon:yes stop_codon:yes gene_type:complete
MGSLGTDVLKNCFKRILQLSGSTNEGVTTATKVIEDGEGNKSCVYLSDDSVIIQPQNDDTIHTFAIRAKNGQYLIDVDSTNNLVKVGTSAVSATTQYAYFGIGSTESGSMIADRHYMIPFNKGTIQTVGDLVIGTGTDPDTTLTITGTADGVTTALWYVPDAITIDAVHWLHAGDAATGDTTRAHLMSYAIDTSNSATSGDLSDGTVLADGADITNAGYEQVYYQSMTVQNPNVSAGRVIAFTFRADSVNSDFSINAVVKYHIQ